MKNVLVPTDFNIDSLKCISSLLELDPNEKFNFILIHVFKLSDSITDLLMLSQRRRDYASISDEFKEGIQYLRDTYKDQIAKIYPECFYGSTLAVFKNFLEYNQIDFILYNKDYNLRIINKNSVDIRKITTKCGSKIVEISALPETTKKLSPKTDIIEKYHLEEVK